MRSDNREINLHAKSAQSLIRRSSRWLVFSVVKIFRPLRAAFKYIHTKTIKRFHGILLSKFRLYARWWKWEYHKHVHITLASSAAIALVVISLLNMQGALALSAWTQSDWSGGIGSSATNQYSSSAGVNTSTANQVTLSQTANWYNSAWAYRKQITIDHTKVNASQTNFPVLISESSDADLQSYAQPSGNDILFTASDGITKLNHEIESYNSTTGALIAWVDVPALSSTVDTQLYMYYGNPNASNQQDAPATWNANYVGVWHLGANGTNLNTNDSTANGNNGTNTLASLATGQIGGAASFNGNGSSISTPLVQNSAIQYSVSAWIKTTSGGVIEQDRGSSGAGHSLTLSLGYGCGIGAGELGFFDDTNATCIGVASTYTFNDGLWHYVEGTWSAGSGSAIASSQFQLYVDGQAVPTTAISIGNDASPLTGSGGTIIGYHQAWSNYFSGLINDLKISDVSRSASWINTSYNNQFSPSTFETFSSVQGEYQSTGSLVSNIFNTGMAENWATLSYSDNVPAGTTVGVLVRAGNQPDLSDAPAFSTCSTIASGGAISSTCAPNKSQYVQYELVFTSNGGATPTLTSIGINYSPSDTVPPPVNASNLAMYISNGGASVSSDQWINVYPYVTWTAGADNTGGSGIQGYCLYLGQDPTGNPITTKGYLGASPINTGGACQYVVSTTSVDLSISGVIGTPLTTSTSPYYLNIVAIDNADNVYTGTPAQFEFRFDNTPPVNPAFVSAPSEFVSSKSVDLTWPTTGPDAASDTASGVAGLQYRIGANGIWYGANHTGTQDATDLLPNNGSYTTVSTPDYANLVEGDNIVYFRTWDNAGNVSSVYTTAVIKINTTSPSSPQNLVATPSVNTTNSFAFSWLEPASFEGSASNITYCYTINVLPTSTNCTYTAAGQTSLSVGAYATEPGDNTVYVVAKDEAGNINYATAASATFTANTPAPGVPLNMNIADISVKANSLWKLALSWESPSTVGAGIATYRVYRSTDGIHFSDIASTAGSSYVDTGLNQQTYYYEIDACDSANNCGALTAPVSMYPTGKYTQPANLLVGPTATVSTRSANISWTTDRNSDSSVEYGLSSNDYLPTAAANTDQVVSHNLTLNNLNAGTTYYYRALWTDGDGNTGTSLEYEFTTLPAPTVSNVVVSGVNLHDASITFTVDNASQAKLYYGPNGSFANTQLINTSSSVSSYTVPISGLTAGTTYTFKVNPFDAQGNEYDQTIFSFSTPPAPAITNVAFQPVPGALTGTEQISWTTNVPTTSQISYSLQGQSISTGLSAIDPAMTTNHLMTIENLNYNTPYQIIATSQDSLGNIATSDLQIFHTGLDTRPPIVSSVVVQPSIRGTGASASGQIIVSWKTDKPGTSQVAYGQGSSGGYSSKTAEDTTLVTNHVVVISNLPTSEVFHLEAISLDNAGNTGVSSNQTTIVGQATDSALSIVFNALQAVFGL